MNTTMKWALATAGLAGLLALASPAAAKDCAALAGAALPQGKVTTATLVPAGEFKLAPTAGGPPPGVAASGFKTLPAFCRIQATLTPTPASTPRP